MTTRLYLVVHGATAANRCAAFPANEPLEERARRALQNSGSIARKTGGAWASPMRAACQTAGALGLDCAENPVLRDVDYGRWAGRTITDIGEDEPDNLALWLNDVEFDGHGGESISMLFRRTRKWLDRQATGHRHMIAITHAAVVRSLIIELLGAPWEAFWRIDIAPASVTEISHNGQRWAVQSCGLPLATTPGNL